MMSLHEALKIKKGLPPDSLHDMLFFRKLMGFPEKVATVNGYPCILEKSVGKPVASYKISGNIVQNGTPSPDTPVEVQGVGKLVTEGEYSGKYEIPVVTRSENHEPITTSIYLSEPLYKGDYISKDKLGGKVHREWGIDEPITEEIELPEIPTFSGTTIIETATEIQPENMEITYKSGR